MWSWHFEIFPIQISQICITKFTFFLESSAVPLPMESEGSVPPLLADAARLQMDRDILKARRMWPQDVPQKTSESSL